jgi:hypothetical protein
MQEAKMIAESNAAQQMEQLNVIIINYLLNM